MGWRFAAAGSDSPAFEGDSEVGLALALLLEHGEVGMVRIVPRDRLLELGFLLQRVPSPEELERFAGRLEAALDAFTRLGAERERRRVRVRASGQGGCGALYVECREGAAAGEAEVISGMVTQVFGEGLIRETGSGGVNVERGILLSRTSPPSGRRREVIGFREGARLLLFEGAGT